MSPAAAAAAAAAATADDPASIVAQLASYDAHSLAVDPEARQAALSLSRKLSASLDDPEAYAMGVALAPMSNLAVRVAIDLDLFSLLAAQSGPVSSAFVAAATGSDPTLATRLLRTCAGIHLLRQGADNGDGGAGSDWWSANAATRMMATGAMTAWHRMLWDMSLTAAKAAPPFLRDTGHRAVEDPARGILQRAFGTAALPPYDVLRTVPALERDFNDAMAVGTSQPEPWFRLYPAEERLLAPDHPPPPPPHAPEGDGPSAAPAAPAAPPLLVDVGGGKGHDLQAFCSAFPGRGPLVLQDLPRVVDSIAPGALDPAIRVHAHDFFTPQPVRGAAAYFVRRVLHQYADGPALRILRGLRGAMRPGRSTLLVCEAVLPDEGAPRAQCELDMCVLVFGGGLERSRSQWVALLTEAGFEVVKIWQRHAAADAIIEAVIDS